MIERPDEDPADAPDEDPLAAPDGAPSPSAPGGYLLLAGPGQVAVVIDPAVAAAIAAHAAAGVTGVRRLEPGIGGLVARLSALAAAQLRPDDHDPLAPTEGVDVEIDGSSARVHVNLTTDGAHRAVTVAHGVQRAVGDALRTGAGLDNAAVSVSVLDIVTDGVLPAVPVATAPTGEGPDPAPQRHRSPPGADPVVATPGRGSNSDAVGPDRPDPDRPDPGRPGHPATPDRLTDGVVRDRVAAAVAAVGGVALLVPLRAQAIRWDTADAALAISFSDGAVEARLVAHRLPLPPLLDAAAAAVRSALAGTGHEASRVRLVVARLSERALAPAPTGPGTPPRDG